MTGSVWKLSVREGQQVMAGDELLVMEAMKMEIPVLAEEAGRVVEIRCERGRAIAAGDVLIVMQADARERA